MIGKGPQSASCNLAGQTERLLYRLSGDRQPNPANSLDNSLQGGLTCSILLTRMLASLMSLPM